MTKIAPPIYSPSMKHIFPKWGSLSLAVACVCGAITNATPKILDVRKLLSGSSKRLSLLLTNRAIDACKNYRSIIYIKTGVAMLSLKFCLLSFQSNILLYIANDDVSLNVQCYAKFALYQSSVVYIISIRGPAIAERLRVSGTLYWRFSK